MIAAIDTTFLTVLLNPKAAARPNPATGSPTPHCRQRIEAMIDDLSKRRSTVLIPAPALAEVLCATDAIEEYLEALKGFAAIEVAAFDAKAAYELGRVIRDAVAKGDKRSGQTGPWQHVKMDRAIVAIAVSRSATRFYSDDDRQINFARMANLEVRSTWDLDLPPEYAQRELTEPVDETWPTHPKSAKSNDSEKPLGS